MIRAAGMHRAHQGELVHALRHLWQQLRDATVPIANLELSENIGFAHPSSASAFKARRAWPAGCRGVVHLQIASGVATREPRASSSAWCSPAFRETAQTGDERSTPVVMAVRGVERLA